ncbi:MAG: Asp-tRNA(Asn)/Glu-tRNA(Gln) amidotransferase subunit GatC [Candidatus Pacebacteria bacterium]|nr:Asp-tRNA(Asn)/Glu-tRNA(Gln) amidotransferase subunit GatC [Candidatus Paceibacterota bacterium]
MISQKEIGHIAKLARLALSAKEKEKLQKELSLVLGYVDQLKEVDVKTIQSFNYSETVNIFREDKKHKKDPKQDLKLLKLAPKTKERYLKVKSIL